MVEEIEEFLTGVRHGVEPDRVLATVLFTDIVGSTEHHKSPFKSVIDFVNENVRSSPLANNGLTRHRELRRNASRFNRQSSQHVVLNRYAWHLPEFDPDRQRSIILPD